MSESMPVNSELELRAERLATVSSCCGFLGEVTLTDSAVIILFAGMLGAGDMIAMLATGVLPLLNGICILPMAFVAMRTGMRKLILRACGCAAAAYFLAVASPWFGGAKVGVLVSAIFLFALCLTGFIAGWFPLLDTFLAKERRTLFFSRMRFSHQLTATLFLFAVGAVIGKNPRLETLQAVLALAGVIFIGRAVAIARIPVFPAPAESVKTLSWSAGLARAAANRPMCGFSLYLFLLNLTTFGTVPLMLLYLKNGLNAPDNIVVLVSACAFFGMLLGYLGVGRLLRLLGLRWAFVSFHAIYLAVNFALFFVSGRTLWTYGTIAFLLMVYSFVIAASSIIASAEMMKLAAPGNKIMAMAFNGAFFYGGAGLSRFLTSLLLGSGMFVAKWHIGAMRICQYQTLLLFYGVGIALAAFFLLLVPAVHSGAKP